MRAKSPKRIPRNKRNSSYQLTMGSETLNVSTKKGAKHAREAERMKREQEKSFFLGCGYPRMKSKRKEKINKTRTETEQTPTDMQQSPRGKKNY